MDNQSLYKEIKEEPEDAVLYFNELFMKDKNPKKVNLTIGAYRDNNGKPWNLPSVMQASKIYMENPNHGYIQPVGDREFTEVSVELAYKKESNGLLAGVYGQDQMVQAQCLSGAGGLLLAFQVLREFYKPLGTNNTIYISEPTWANHRQMAALQGFDVKTYDYYDLKKRVFTYDLMIDCLKKVPNNSVVLFHPVGHNPTGFDPSPQQWNEILEICKERQIFSLFDMAYQGFVSGDPDLDAYSVQLFAKNKMPMMVVQSFAKNFGLYGQRIGCFSMPNLDKEFVRKMQGFLRVRLRSLYSSNPRFGSDIVKIILKDPKLNQQWRDDIKVMSSRIQKMRELFYSALQRNNVKGDWKFVIEQQGMFAYTPLTVEQVRALKTKYAIFMLESGRISISGLNESNVEYVAQAVKDVVN
jgi:aspartate/tyrosine/aromatic aminotransferase